MSEIKPIDSWSAKGVQEDVLKAVIKKIPRSSKVLELGAGAGALSQQLSAKGYQVMAADWNAESFKPSNIVCHHVDCDDADQLLSFFEKESFDAIICGDLIEHLKYPWKLIESCYQLIKPEGYLFISTPYTTSATSRINMLITGNVNSFGPLSEEIGHISPILPSYLSRIFRQSGFENIELVGIGKKQFLRNKSIKAFIQLLLAILLKPFMTNASFHPVILGVAKKKQADSLPNTPLGIGTSGAYKP